MSETEHRTFTRANRGSKIESLLNSEIIDKGEFWGSDEVTAIFAEEKDDTDYQVQCLSLILLFFKYFCLSLYVFYLVADEEDIVDSDFDDKEESDNEDHEMELRKEERREKRVCSNFTIC